MSAVILASCGQSNQNGNVYVVGNTTANGTSTSNTFTAAQVTFSSTTNSIPYSLGSGAVYVAGGMSIAKDIWVSGNIYAGNLIIAITTDTMYLANSTSTGSRTLAQNGTATALKITSTSWIISGQGLS